MISKVDNCRLSAFTLGEMLIVIAIIGILAALTLTALSRGIALGRRTSCANNERQMGQALQMFLTDKHAYPLVAIDFPDHYTGWENQIARAELDGPAHNPKPPLYPRPGIWHCPAANPPLSRPAYADYGYNAYGMSPQTASNSLGLGGQHIWNGYEHQPSPAITGSDVAVPSDMMAIGDGFVGNASVIHDGRYSFWRTYGVEETGDYVGSTKQAYARHNGRENALFCDGHVESPTLKSLFVATNDTALARWNRDHQPHRDLLDP